MLNRALWFVSHSWLVLLDAQQHAKLIRQYIFNHLVGKQFADCSTCLTTQRILFLFLQTITFLPFCTCLSFMSGHVSFPMFHSFAIFPFQYAPAGSVKRPTSTFLVAWPEHNFAFLFAWRAHNLLIAWPAYHLTDIYVLVSQTIAFLLFFFCLSFNTSDNTYWLTWWLA